MPFTTGPAETRALVVLSGGMDSCTALAIAKKENDYVECISFDYGQRHDLELHAARDIANWFTVPHIVQEVSLGVGGVLMRHQDDMPHMTYDELSQAQGPSPTYVPYRNGTFLSHATSMALERNLHTIYAGMHGEDAHNWAYPDCTPEFIGAMQNAIYIGSYFKVRLVCPFTYMTKAQIIEKALSLAAPLHLTLSCYEGTIPACGKCPTCVARLEAFKAAGATDPIEYEFDKYREGRERARESFKAGAELRRSLDNE